MGGTAASRTTTIRRHAANAATDGLTSDDCQEPALPVVRDEKEEDGADQHLRGS